MSDILIRGIPAEVVAVIDAKARRAGLSRTEYLRRALVREGSDAAVEVTTDDLHTFSDTFADLGDQTVMDDAWR